MNDFTDQGAGLLSMMATSKVRSKGRQRKETGQRLQDFFFIVNVQFQLILQTCTSCSGRLEGMAGVNTEEEYEDSDVGVDSGDSEDDEDNDAE